MDTGIPAPLFPGESAAAGPLADLLLGKAATVCVEPDGRLSTGGVPALLVPGSFNPLHHGHLGLAAAASRRTGVAAAFELSVVNVDKPPLAEAEVRRRAAAFVWRAAVWLTRAPTFVEKARLFPGAVFVVGADTADRVILPHYYGGSEERMARALGEIRECGCRFLVAGRVDAAGRFRGFESAQAGAFRDLFEAIPEEEFRADVSSTQLRAERA